MMTRTEAIALLRKSDLRSHAEELEAMLALSARLSITESPARTTSKVGGQALLPAGHPWPIWDRTEYLEADVARMEEDFRRTKAPGMRKLADDRRMEIANRAIIHLPFVCQLDLSEINAVVALPHLPQDGSLAFFCEPDDAVGFDPLAKGSCRVLYFPSGTKLVPTMWPDAIEPDNRFNESPLTPSAEWTLPTWPPHTNGAFRWDSDAHERLVGLLDPKSGKAPIHRCGGHPQDVQGDMRLQCQLVSHGIYCGTSEGYRDPRRKSLEAGVSEWELLLQIDSDDAVPCMWGDGGRLYFWAQRPQTQHGNFDGARAEMQCY